MTLKRVVPQFFASNSGREICRGISREFHEATKAKARKHGESPNAGSQMDFLKVIRNRCNRAHLWPFGPFLGNKNSAQSFSDRSFWKPLRVVGRPRLRVMDVRAKMLAFSRIWPPWRSFGPGYPREWPRMSVRGMSVPKTSSLGWFLVPWVCYSPGLF